MKIEKRTQEKVGFVFIYGSGLERRIWEKVITGFENPSLLVDFPLRNGTYESRQQLDLKKYVIHIKRQVEEWEVQKFVLVAHSLGGIPALQVAADLSDRLVGFVVIGAAIPKKGGSFLSILPFPKRILMSILLRKIGTRPPESAIRRSLCNDLSTEQAAEVVQGFVPESVRVYTDQIDVSVPMVPKLYIKLSRDKEFSQSLQDKMIANLSSQPGLRQSRP